MADPLRHRQTKGAATDMVDLTPPRHIPTLPNLSDPDGYRERQVSGHGLLFPSTEPGGPLSVLAGEQCAPRHIYDDDAGRLVKKACR